MVNARYSNGVLTFENPCPDYSPAANRCGEIVTIRTPGTVDGSYSDFLIIRRDGDDFLALLIDSPVYSDWKAFRWAPPCGKAVSLKLDA